MIKTVALKSGSCLVLAALLLPAWAADEEDVWRGKQRIDIVALLGEPDKATKRPDGSEVLVYKLIRVGDGAVPGPSFRVFELSGVGRVGRVVKNEDPAVSEGDEYGRQSSPGGLGPTRLSSADRDEPPKKDRRTRGKVRFEITLDASETVQDWSVSPK